MDGTFTGATGGVEWTIAGTRLVLLGSGAVFVPDERALVAGDLHLGRSERTARSGCGLLPPYEDVETLARLEAEIARTAPACVVCLGDSFDDMAAARAAAPALARRVGGLAQGRRWIWVAGNHDPVAPKFPGEWVPEATLGALVLDHRGRPGRAGEISAHYHPKAGVTRRGRRIVRRCFLADRSRLILPAFGTYTGGLDARDPAFDALLGPDAWAGMLGRTVTVVRRARLG